MINYQILLRLYASGTYLQSLMTDLIVCKHFSYQYVLLVFVVLEPSMILYASFLFCSILNQGIKLLHSTSTSSDMILSICCLAYKMQLEGSIIQWRGKYYIQRISWRGNLLQEANLSRRVHFKQVAYPLHLFCKLSSLLKLLKFFYISLSSGLKHDREVACSCLSKS